MAARTDPLVITDMRGGRNGSDSPLALPADQCVEAYNVDWWAGLIGNRRGGADNVSLSGYAPTSGIRTLIRHVPAADEGAAMLFAVDGANPTSASYLSASTTWASPTSGPATTGETQHATGVSFNGKLFFFSKTGTDKAYVYHGSVANTFRRVGFTVPGAPTAADSGGIGGLSGVRYYRVRWVQINSTTIVRRSEAGAALTFTPDGAHLTVTITRPTAPNEGETHWEVEASIDNVNWYQYYRAISGATAIATTTATDANSASGIIAGSVGVAEPAGYYTTFTSVKYGVTDGNRLLLAGAWETGKNSRVWFTPVLGSSDQGDDERIPQTTQQKNYLDLNENDGGAITGMAATLYGAIYVFKYRQIHVLTPTGEVFAPYSARKLHDGIGCIEAKTICAGIDEAGRPCVYFLSHVGPYRLGQNGLQYLGRDIEDIWATVNLSATGIVGHAVHYADKHQVWIWVATSAANDPTLKLVFDTLRGRPDDTGAVRRGWSLHDGPSATAYCSVMFANTLGASMSRDLKPYIGYVTASELYKCDTTNTQDKTTNYQAYVKCRPILAPAGHVVTTAESLIVAKAKTSCTLTQTLVRDFGAESRTGAVDLTLTSIEGSAGRVIRKVEASAMADAWSLEVQVGDSAAINNPLWTVDQIMLPLSHVGGLK